MKNHVFAVILLKTRLENLPSVLQNEWQSIILVRLYQIMLKIIILSQIGADRYQKPIFEVLLLSIQKVQWFPLSTGRAPL